MPCRLNMRRRAGGARQNDSGRWRWGSPAVTGSRAKRRNSLKLNYIPLLTRNWQAWHVQAISLLRAAGQAGPYALALSSAVYADTFVPIAGTTVLPADQIRPLVSRGLVDTGGLPAGRGLIASLGGNTIDLVITVDPTSAFVQVDEQGIYQFRVFERWALRVKDPGALVRLVFKG